MPIDVKPIEVPRILDLNSMVLFEEGWLPEGLFPELDELREEHHELVAEVKNAGHLAGKLRQQYKEEDEARQEALVKFKDAPPMTGSAERMDRLEEARAFLQVRIDRLAAFVEKAVGVIKDKGGYPPEFADEPGLKLPDWRQEFASQLAEVDTEIEAAKEALRVAERKEAAIKSKERWLNQTVRAKGGVYMAASQSPPLMTREEWDADKVPAALSGTEVG